MLNLYKVSIIKYDYDNYTDFIVVGDNVKTVLEAIYHKVCYKTDENGNGYYNDIPYYLRSSNMRIETLGEFVPSDIWDGNAIISYGWLNA